MKKEIEQQIFEKMKAKDFGESMCNETKLNVLKWTMQQLRKHDVSNRRELLIAFLDDINASCYEHIKSDEGKVDAFIRNL
jgi:acetolactate synthase small subunit